MQIEKMPKILAIFEQEFIGLSGEAAYRNQPPIFSCGQCILDGTITNDPTKLTKPAAYQ
jgi:hypothetical protein